MRERKNENEGKMSMVNIRITGELMDNLPRIQGL